MDGSTRYAVEGVVRNALGSALSDIDMLDYLVEMILEETCEILASKPTRSLTDCLSRAVQDTLVDAEAALRLPEGITTLVESIHASVYAVLRHDEDEADDDDDMGFVPGMPCMALLPQDDEWHEAEIVSVEGLKKRKVDVRFVEFDLTLAIAVENVVRMEDVADDAAASVNDGCEMCERPVRLTEHHLIPRQMHAKYLQRGYTRDFLNRCITICRACHSAIHSAEDNRTLAAEFNTLEKLLAHARIAKYVAYARKQKPRIKCH
ncbi:Aste57867_19067 [Aphanomyces stellatus]|uniref:Aste57867_19067 protein n=1 Tax=Aphanomyces stellatus TaxID=120398 RepID=A0A485LCB5_9STRA|nr:hypothetical protein As57867_019003 [Aphanomyces stellatus]VFT95792.1 Aste57867_19067 [Aphanomyces stellatus]